MGINLAALGSILGDGESVLRGLNPFYCEDGLPTEGCFILKRNDLVSDGPSFGILLVGSEQADSAPLGAVCGISPEAFATVLPSPDYGIAELNVGVALAPIRTRMAGFVQNDEAAWGQHRKAHAMLTGYQPFTNKDRNDLRRHLVKLAAQRILKKAAARP